MPDTGNDVTQLRAALEAAHRENAGLRSTVSEAQNRVRGAEGAGWAAREAAADAAIAALQGEIEGLKRSQSALLAEGKFDEAADIAEKLGDATARRREQAQVKAHAGRQREAASQAPAQTDPLANFSATERDWINKNPAYLSDPEFQAKVNAAAEYASRFEGIARGTPAWFEYIEKKVFPERAQTAARAEGGSTAGDGGTAGAGNTGEGGDSPFSDTGLDPDNTVGGEGGASGLQQHTREAAPVSNTTDPPVMRIELDEGNGGGEAKPQPQPRAVGKGGDGIRSVAAPPSRNIQNFARQASRTGRIEPTQEEVNVAIELAQSIEPEIAAKGPRAAVEWYYAMAHAPSNQSTRRRSWARDAVVS